MPGGFRRVYVPQALDASFDVGPALTVTRVFRSLVQASTVAVHVSSAKDAEVVAELKIENTADALGVTGAPAPNQSYTVTQFALTMAGTLRLYDAGGAIVWQTGAVPVTEYYLAGQAGGSEALQQTENNRRRALDRAAENLARELYKKMVESF